MIVRESPKAKGASSNSFPAPHADRPVLTCAAAANPPNWPPKSPYEALLSSPSGRRKYAERRARTSVSPSPAKRRPVSMPQAHNDGGETTEDEDEETLQLKLQAIEARLKLKQLQKARRAEPESRAIPTRPGRTERPRSDADVQVPVSPIRARHKPEEPRSPARVLLGIDKGLKASDVSLKRPGQVRATSGLARANTTGSVATPKIKSFSERLAESRTKEKEREEREHKHEERKARGFGLGSNVAGTKRERPPSSRGSSFSSSVAEQPQPQTRFSFTGLPQTRSSFTDVPQTRNSFTGTPQTRSSFTDMPPPGSKTHSRTHSRLLSSQEPVSSPRRDSMPHARSISSGSRPLSKEFKPRATSSSFSKYEEIAQRSDSSDAHGFESLSGLHLKSRDMQHSVVTRTLEGKTLFTIPQLLKTVKAPDYDPPDWENDYVVMGVICSKSSPRDTQNSARDNSRGTQERKEHGKFMVIRLTDLKWELDLFLFDSGYEHFWKLPIGTLVAILNPDIMPPKDRNSGKFSLKLTNSDDTVLEIGVARDLDFCHAKKKDGRECGQWVDGRKTEFCEFHLAMQVEKSKRGRMEVNGMVGPGGGGGGMFARKGPNGFNGDQLRREGKIHDRQLHETMFIAPRPGGAARMLDKDDQGFERGASREERHRKQLAAKEKERDLAKRLGDMGEGTTGGDYLKRRVDPSAPLSTTNSKGESAGAKQEKALEFDYQSLLSRKAADVSLNRGSSGSLIPSKRKHSTASKATAASNSEPVGWSFNAHRRGLVLSPSKARAMPPSKSRPDSAMRGTRASSPAKKKARLLLPEKGIREPGRESLGGLDAGLLAAMDDDDDDLEFV